MSLWFIMVATALTTLATVFLRTGPAHRYWGVASTVSAAAAVVYILLNRDPGPPYNSPVILTAAFVLCPMLFTFALARPLLARLNTVTAAVLAVPVGAVLYALGVYVSLIIGVNAGVLWK